MRKPPPLMIIDALADDKHTSGPLNPATLELIVFHATVGLNLDETLKYLSTNPNSDKSVDRLIDKQGNIYKITPDNVVANHVGYSAFGKHYSGSPYGNCNHIALGIEFLNANNGKDPYTLPQITSGALQVREWWYYHGFHLKIVAHGPMDTKGKTDPFLFPWELFYKVLFAKCSELW